MSRFVDKTPVKIDFSNGDWVNIQRLSYAEFMKLGASVNMEDMASKIQFGTDLLRMTIVEWSFKNNKGNEVKYEPGLIDDLDVATVVELSEKIQSILMPEKKSSK